jgi:hypothetical protein
VGVRLAVAVGVAVEVADATGVCVTVGVAVAVGVRVIDAVAVGVDVDQAIFARASAASMFRSPAPYALGAAEVVEFFKTPVRMASRTCSRVRVA